MRRYLLTIGLIFSALAGTLLATACWIAAPFGALKTLGQLAEIQSKCPSAVVLPFDLRYNGAFKLARVEETRPDILWFSSSRAGAARASMFAPYTFYNMSFTAWTTTQLLDAFDRATRNVHPKVAILELDYFLFTDDWERADGPSRTMIYREPLWYAKASLGNFIRTAPFYWSRLNERLVSDPAFLGTQALLSLEGFRYDGSYIYSSGHIEDARLHYKTADVLVGSMPGAPNMSERQKQPLIRLAELARQRGIKLIGIQLPYIRPGVDFLDHDKAYRHLSGVWRQFESRQTRDWLTGLGIQFFDLAHSPIDDDLNNFIDAYHPAGPGMLKVIDELLGNPKFQADFPEMDRTMIENEVRKTAESDNRGGGL